MGRGTRYYSWEVFLAIVDAFVSARVDVRTYLLDGAIDGSETNGIICNPKLELESSRFTFDLVPLSYESVDVIVGENWLLRHKVKMVCHEKVVKMPWSLQGEGCSNGNLLWKRLYCLVGESWVVWMRVID
ncbi:putative reverse transcriptase domain-containing protein [Tanacetum coccineum]